MKMEKEDLLQKYFSSGLNDKENILLNDLIENDDDFKKQFELEKDVVQVLKSKRRNLIKNELKKIRIQDKKSPNIDSEHDSLYPLLFSKNNKTSKKKKLALWGTLAIAAGLAIFFTLHVYNTNFNNPIDNLFAVNYSVYPNVEVPIEKSNNQKETIELKAFIAYESGKYDKAISLFEQMTNEKNTNYAEFYLGQSYMANQKIVEAIDIFEKLVDKSAKYSNESRWFLSLAYLKNKDKKNALHHLEIIVANSSYKSEEAKSIINALK